MSKKGKKRKSGAGDQSQPQTVPTYGGGTVTMPPSSSIPPPFNPPPAASASGGPQLLSPRLGTSKLPKTVSEEREKGIAFYNRGDLGNAIACFTKAIGLTPSDHASLPSLFTRRALCNLRMNQNEAAIDDARRALEINPKFVKAYVCRGVGYFRLMKFQNANEDYTMASKLQQGNQRFQEALVNAKREAMENRDFFDTKLLDALLLSIEDSDNEVQKNDQLEREASRGKGTQSKGGKGFATKEASDVPLLVPVGEYLSTPMNIPPGATSTKVGLQSVREKELGNIAFQSGSFLVALENYSKAIRLNPQEPVFYSNRALVYLKLCRYYESIADATSSIERKPSIKAYARRASAWAYLKEHMLAVEDYKRALEFEPKNLECLQEYHRCLACLEKEYRTKLQSNPQNEKWKEAIRQTLEEMKGVTNRIQAVQKQNQSSPPGSVNQPSIGVAVGVALSKGDLDASIAYFTSELAQDPNNSDALLRRGEVYLQRGDFEKAMSDFKVGLNRDPDNKELQRGLKQVRTMLSGRQ